MEGVVGLVAALAVIAFIFALVTEDSWWFLVHTLVCAGCVGVVTQMAFSH